ncbi:hypothetical protein GXW82_14590 [Streptacidiphilus sp. 4-A2]|nr:hypothetical protein [Streptacidiphilus sp. 4-A2]
MAQEALSNIAKHSRASKVHLTLTYLDDTLLLDVADNGVGFTTTDRPAASRNGNGFGLAGMRHRLERLSGTLNLESAPGEGTIVNAAVPIQAPAPTPFPVPNPVTGATR